ncbi:MAG: response regulator [Haliea sp.]|nr:MAG: response regulator [Haliea sp.]
MQAAAAPPEVASLHAAPQVDELIEREQADTLVASSLPSPVGTGIVALCLWILCYRANPAPEILAWAALTHLSQAVRFVRTLAYVRTPTERRDPIAAARWYQRSVGLAGAIWGLAPWLFFPAGNTALISLMVLIMLGMGLASVTSLASYRSSIFYFVVPMLSGLATALLWQGSAVLVGMGVGVVVFMLGTLRFAWTHNRVLTEALRARYVNEALARNLAAQVDLVERASREKTRFFASASHDLRQPLHSLGLFGAAILARLKGSPEEPLARNLMHCVDALEVTFNSMLDASKLDAGVVTAHPEPVALVAVFRRLQSTFGKYAEAQGLALRFKPGGKHVLADPVLLERLLGNLVHNAIKFTQHGGVVVVARGRGGHVSIEVWDTGQGIAAREVAHIFEEFYQVGNRERDRSKGLGMGLAIVRRLSGLMAMPVQVESTPGRGTVMKVLARPAVAPDPAAVLDARSGAFRALHGLHVLVVDDEETVRESSAVALGLYGIQVELADGLATATAVARRLGTGLDLVIVDFRLRDDEDGVQLVAQLRSLLGRPLPALLVTGDTARDRVREAQQSGLRVLYKPVKTQELAEAIRDEMSRPLSTAS